MCKHAITVRTTGCLEVLLVLIPLLLCPECPREFNALLLDAGMPIDQVQKFLRHKHLSTTQLYAETSLRSLGEHYLRALS
jgi:integrase